MKLNLFIARSGFCSRRMAARIVKEGKVTVNGRVVVEPWHEVTGRDAVRAGHRVINAERQAYILFNKPKGVTTTCADRFAEDKIVDLIPERFGRVYPVGRLDKSSRGLIILTNDGDLCHKLTHPSFEIEKEYVVTIKGEAEESIIKRLSKGVKEGGDILKVKSASMDKSWPNKTRLNVVICEGKKRHLRRLFEALGYDVVDLVRVRIGRIRLGDLRDGHYRVVDKDFIVKHGLSGRYS